ncbi:MAG: glycine cleavage system aminomethyltransferase GcvT [Thermaerobacterales bacterium]
MVVLASAPSSEPKLERTPLYPLYERYGARTVSFGGWDMPVQFSGLMAEHQAVRNQAGLFDVCHMGEVEIKGSDALAAVQTLMTNDAGRLREGRAQYTVMCNAAGGVVDDLLVYRLAVDHFLLVINAGNIEKDWNHIKGVTDGFSGLQASNRSREYGLLALQGPRSPEILGRALAADGVDPTGLKPFRFVTGARIGPADCLISRTGYTGEDGFEIYCDASDAPAIWERLLDVGGSEGLIPCGLGARDTLRFEACLALYGHELNEKTNPLEAGLGFTVKLTKESFIGREALLRIKEGGGPKRRLAGLEMLERGIAREGYAVTDAQGHEIGHVTTGTFSPTLQKPLALAYVPAEQGHIGNKLGVMIRGQEKGCKVVKTPFYKRQP